MQQFVKQLPKSPQIKEIAQIKIQVWIYHA